MAKTKLKGCRPLNDINVEYSHTCGMLGDYTFRRSQLATEVEKLNKRLRELDMEAAAARQQEAAIKAELDARKEEVMEATPDGVEGEART